MPLPNAISWYAHYFPVWFLKTITVFAEINDLFVPLMFLVPIRSIKKLAFYIQVMFEFWVISHFFCRLNYNDNGKIYKLFGIFKHLVKFNYCFQVFMQIGILASGNYSYYNLLYIVLCLSLLDDHTFYRGIIFTYIVVLFNYLDTFNFELIL